MGNGRFVRLLDSQGNHYDLDTDIHVGGAYTITAHVRKGLRPPHVEDVLVTSMKYEGAIGSSQKLAEILTERLKVKVWSGSTDVLFDGNLHWTDGGSGYVSESGGIPSNSVGFWRPNRPIVRKDFHKKVRYSYPIRWRNIPFVGFQEPVDVIPAGTLVRVSLARWWAPEELEEQRCYLQLSGWYGLD